MDATEILGDADGELRPGRWLLDEGPGEGTLLKLGWLEDSELGRVEADNDGPKLDAAKRLGNSVRWQGQSLADG